MVEVVDSLIVAQRLAEGFGWTWTLASRLGEILDRIEELFGPRDPSFTILGTEFGGDVPHSWFPGGRRRIVIHLTSSALKNERNARYQLAHEAVHLLDPVTTGNGASVLEEGLAAYFSLAYIREEAPGFHGIGERAVFYERARVIVESLMAAHPDAVKTLRSQGKRIDDFTAQDLRETCPKLSDDDIATLTQRFATWSS